MPPKSQRLRSKPSQSRRAIERDAMATSSTPTASFKTTAWSFSDPIEALSWLPHLGAVRAALLLTIDIHVKPLFQDWQVFDNFLDGTVWYMLLTALSKLCTGLRVLTVYFCEPDRGARLMGWKGYGRSLMFARGLATMSNLSLEKLVLKGFYAAPWPKYLKDTIGVPVTVESSRGEEAALKRYQQGTHHLVPQPKRDVEEGATGESQKVAFRRFQKMVGSACERLDFTRLTNMLQMPMEVIKEEKKKEEADLKALLEAAMTEAEGKEVKGEGEDIGKEENKEAEPKQAKDEEANGEGNDIGKEENKEAKPEQAEHGEGKGEGDNVEKEENKDH